MSALEHTLVVVHPSTANMSHVRMVRRNSIRSRRHGPSLWIPSLIIILVALFAGLVQGLDQRGEADEGRATMTPSVAQNRF
jgi:hypothetical protein